MRFAICLALIGLATLAMAQSETPPPAVAAKMRESTERLLAALPERQRATGVRPFDDSDRVDWHYTPRSRNGISFKELDARGRDAVHALLKTALSAVGYRKVVNIIELELVLREMETFGLMRDPERYHVTVYGTPSRPSAGDGASRAITCRSTSRSRATGWWSTRRASSAPIRRRCRAARRKGCASLGDEHDAGWAVLDSLSEAQRREAVISTRTYGDIVTSNRDKVEPLEAAGIAGVEARRTRSARSLWKIVELYAASFEPGLAEARLARARGRAASTACASAGRDRHARRAALLSHPGSALPDRIRRLPGRRQSHSHRVAGLHRRLRARAARPRAAFGRDLLRDHYASARGTSHRPLSSNAQVFLRGGLARSSSVFRRPLRAAALLAAFLTAGLPATFFDRRLHELLPADAEARDLLHRPLRGLLPRRDGAFRRALDRLDGVAGRLSHLRLERIPLRLSTFGAGPRRARACRSGRPRTSRTCHERHRAWCRSGFSSWCGAWPCCLLSESERPREIARARSHYSHDSVVVRQPLGRAN